MRQDFVDHKRILNTVVRHSDNDPGRVVFIGPPQALQILNIATFLFNLIEVPHLPLPVSPENRAGFSDLFHSIHSYAASALIVLVLLHIAAALRHQFILGDSLLTRMTPDLADPLVLDGIRLGTSASTAIVGGVFLLVIANNTADRVSLALGHVNPAVTNASACPSGWIPATVSYTAVVLGSEINGKFADAHVQVDLRHQDPDSWRLAARVNTATGSSGSPQVDSALPGRDWLNVMAFPEAAFLSSAIVPTGDSSFNVSGSLTLKDVSRDIDFPLELDVVSGQVTGAFSINRLDYGIGAGEQPDDSNAAFNILIEFEFAYP